jgi:predicted RNase H-like HicB family nuclease
MKLQVILESSYEGGYTVYVPALPGCISEGDNIDEALENITEAIELYLEPLEEDIASNQNIIVIDDISFKKSSLSPVPVPRSRFA